MHSSSITPLRAAVPALRPSPSWNKKEPETLFSARRKASDTASASVKTVQPKKVIYAGSFDPPTNGHLWMMEQAAALFDKLTVVMAVNPDKKYTFTAGQRLKMLRDMTRGLGNIEIVPLDGRKFLVDFARKIGAVALIRGLRNGTDFEQELALSNLNRKAAPEIQTLTYFTPKHLGEVSSSNVKSMAKLLGWRERVIDMVPPGVFTAMKAKVLEDRFAGLSKTLGMPDAEAQKYFELLNEKYNQPERAYHNFDHLIDLFEALDEAMIEAPSLAPKKAALFEIALFFHDVIDERQNPRGVDESADLALEFLGKAAKPLPEADREYVRSLIMATKYGSPESMTDNPDADLFNDLDLSTLGASPEKFDKNSDDIRFEYSHVPDELFREGRKRILKLFLERTPLYKTAHFRETLEDKARANLTRSLANLEARAV